MQASVSSGDVTGASAKTILAVFAAAARRASVLQVEIECTDTPADATAVFALGFITADGTGTGVTPGAVDSADGSPSCTAKANYSAEPTYAAAPKKRLAVNQRVTYIWNVPFDGEWKTALSGGTNLGIGLQMISGPALKYNATFQWRE